MICILFFFRCYVLFCFFCLVFSLLSRVSSSLVLAGFSSGRDHGTRPSGPGLYVVSRAITADDPGDNGLPVYATGVYFVLAKPDGAERDRGPAQLFVLPAFDPPPPHNRKKRNELFFSSFLFFISLFRLFRSKRNSNYSGTTTTATTIIIDCLKQNKKNTPPKSFISIKTRRKKNFFFFGVQPSGVLVASSSYLFHMCFRRYSPLSSLTVSRRGKSSAMFGRKGGKERENKGEKQDCKEKKAKKRKNEKKNSFFFLSPTFLPPSVSLDAAVVVVRFTARSSKSNFVFFLLACLFRRARRCLLSFSREGRCVRLRREASSAVIAYAKRDGVRFYPKRKRDEGRENSLCLSRAAAKAFGHFPFFSRRAAFFLLRRFSSSIKRLLSSQE